MKQGVKIYNYKTTNQQLRLPMLEHVQADMRKQNQLGWYVHQMVGPVNDRWQFKEPDNRVKAEGLGLDYRGGEQEDSAYMVVYRRDEEM